MLPPKWPLREPKSARLHGSLSRKRVMPFWKVSAANPSSTTEADACRSHTRVPDSVFLVRNAPKRLKAKHSGDNSGSFFQVAQQRSGSLQAPLRLKPLRLCKAGKSLRALPIGPRVAGLPSPNRVLGDAQEPTELGLRPSAPQPPHLLSCPILGDFQSSSSDLNLHPSLHDDESTCFADA